MIILQHKISLNTPVKSPDGALLSYWFYENSRGKWDELKVKKQISKMTQRKEKGKMAIWYASHEVAKSQQVLTDSVNYLIYKR